MRKLSPSPKIQQWASSGPSFWTQFYLTVNFPCCCCLPYSQVCYHHANFWFHSPLLLAFTTTTRRFGAIPWREAWASFPSIGIGITAHCTNRCAARPSENWSQPVEAVLWGGHRGQPWEGESFTAHRGKNAEVLLIRGSAPFWFHRAFCHLAGLLGRELFDVTFSSQATTQKSPGNEPYYLPGICYLTPA